MAGRPGAALYAQCAAGRERGVRATSFLGESQAGAYRWTFETLDATPPQVARTAPEDGAADVARKGAVTVFFDKALLVGGEGVEFEVTDPSGEPVVGHVAWAHAVHP